MAATYYAQLLRAYRWREMVDAIQNAFAIVRENIEQEGIERFPTDGQDIWRGDGKDGGILVNVSTDDEESRLIASIYLGRTYRDSPSGSFYAPWSDVPDSVRDRDARWYDAFEKVAHEFGLGIVSGEGDPTDTYVIAYSDFDNPFEVG